MQMQSPLGEQEGAALPSPGPERTGKTALAETPKTPDSPDTQLTKRLDKLKSRFTKGIIDETEHARQRAEIIREMS